MALFGQLKNNLKPIFAAITILFFLSCNNEAEQKKESVTTTVTAKKTATPTFNGDSAYTFVKAQVDFGPRVPGTSAHEKCADYLVEKLKSYGWQVSIQKGTVQTFDKKQFTLKNIIAEYKPELNNRTLLTAHWDTRPWADLDSINKNKPFDGANDGGSGVAVLLEFARQLNLTKIEKGIDIILFDIEDYGQEQEDTRYPPQEDTWCLGSQYWAKHPHKTGYYANYGILLDMVGGKNPQFPMEGTSMQYAPDVVEKIWNIANNMGYGNYFTTDVTGETTDDHLYVNTLANIKCIDIVHYETKIHNYPFFHHRHSDNMSIIDKNTLQMVGQLLLEVIYSEQ
jgi:glutaminyl-peptide cyclotransferase